MHRSSKVVNVYRLITRHTLEEKIMGLQRFKLNIANSVVSQDNASLSSMGTEQLLDLFQVGFRGVMAMWDIVVELTGFYSRNGTGR